MIKSGTRVSNTKGTGGFEFTKDYEFKYPYENVYDHVKPYDNQRKPKRGDKIPRWFINWISQEEYKYLAEEHEKFIDAFSQPPLDYATESEHLISATFSQPPLDYAPKPIPVIYTRTINDVTYSIEDHEGEYAVYRAEVSDGEYFAYCMSRTRWLWWAKFMINVDRWF